MSLSEHTAHTAMTGPATARALSKVSQQRFLLWTLFWWGSVGLCALLFFVGSLDFLVSTKLSLYGISIWLNGWMLGLLAQTNDSRSKLSIYHDCLVLWLLSYAITNLLWEMPWVAFSPFVFTNISTIDDVVAHTGYMRENILHMYWWILASFASVDLRTVNHNPTFYTIEIYAFVNFFTTLYFFYLNKKRSPYRYLIAVLGCGEPVAATFIFSFSEVFAGFENMPGGIADTLLALVWTQYQYFVFPLIFGYVGYQLLLDDWRHCHAIGTNKAPTRH
ncbi:MAG TPA: hypothetical protein VIM96_04775 [Pseudomonadales bacterium]